DSGAFLPTPPMLDARASHTSTLLPDGRVLVAGGVVSADAHATNAVEIYDPLANAWTPAAPMNSARAGHTATALFDGRVVITGGSPRRTLGDDAARRKDAVRRRQGRVDRAGIGGDLRSGCQYDDADPGVHDRCAAAAPGHSAAAQQRGPHRRWDVGWGRRSHSGTVQDLARRWRRVRSDEGAERRARLGGGWGAQLSGKCDDSYWTEQWSGDFGRR